MSCGVLQPHHADLIRYEATCRPKRLHPDKTATLLQALMTDLQAAGAWTFVAKTRCRHQAAPRSACCSCVPLSPDSHCGAGWTEMCRGRVARISHTGTRRPER